VVRNLTLTFSSGEGREANRKTNNTKPINAGMAARTEKAPEKGKGQREKKQQEPGRQAQAALVVTKGVSWIIQLEANSVRERQAPEQHKQHGVEGQAPHRAEAFVAMKRNEVRKPEHITKVRAGRGGAAANEEATTKTKPATKKQRKQKGTEQRATAPADKAHEKQTHTTGAGDQAEIHKPLTQQNQKGQILIINPSGAPAQK
jgi:hypothetical protein